MTAKKHFGWRHEAVSRATRFDGTIARAISRLVFSALLLVGHWDTLAESGAAAPSGSITNLAALRPSGSADHGRISGWKPIFLGVEMCEGSSRIPRPLQVRAVRVDLKQPTVDFLVTPRLADGRGVFGARKTSEFLSEFRCQVAINASVFDVLAKKRGDPMRVEDLSLSRGDLYLSSNKWDALLISTNNRAWIARAPVDAAGAYNGCSGFYALLDKGRNNGRMKDLHPRSAVGISRNGRYLILMAIDGRQPRYSEGATTAETAEWMRKLGAYDALNLDGGGSTALVIEGEDGAPLAVNRPCGSPVGTERRVANHLGVYARKLPPAKPQLN